MGSDGKKMYFSFKVPPALYKVSSFLSKSLNMFLSKTKWNGVPRGLVFGVYLLAHLTPCFICIVEPIGFESIPQCNALRQPGHFKVSTNLWWNVFRGPKLYRNVLFKWPVKPAASVRSGADILWWWADDDWVSLIADAEQVCQAELKGGRGEGEQQTGIQTMDTKTSVVFIVIGI